MRDYNVVILGAGGVGKSSVTRRYVFNRYEQVYDPTIEDCFTKIVEHPAIGPIQLDIIDTAGFEQFTASNLRTNDSDGFVIVWSVDSMESCQLAGLIVTEIRKNVPGSDENVQEIPIVVLCNKADLSVDWRMAANASINRFEREYGIRVIRTSAKTGVGVDDAFNTLVEKLLCRFPKGIKRLKKKKSSWWKTVF